MHDNGDGGGCYEEDDGAVQRCLFQVGFPVLVMVMVMKLDGSLVESSVVDLRG